MKINSIKTYNSYPLKNNIKEKTTPKNNNNINSKEIAIQSYPANYYIASFGKKHILGQNMNQQGFYYTDLIHNDTNAQIKNISNLVANDLTKYFLIGALSKNEEAVPDIVEFINTSKKFNKFTENANDIGEYQINFVKDFLINYPQYEEKYLLEIKQIHSDFDSSSKLGEGALKNMITSIAESVNKFLEKITLLKNAPKEFPYSIEMLNKIAIFANPLILKTDSTNKDFAKLLIKNTNYDELKILNGSNETKEYNELFPEGIKNKIRGFINKPEYLNLANSSYFAILQEAIDNNFIDESYLLKLLNQNVSIDKQLKNLLETFEFNKTKLNNNYNKYKLPLNPKEYNSVKEVLLKEIPNITEKDEFNVQVLLRSQGNYLKNIFKDDNISKFIIMKFWNDFDNIHGTNYSTNIEEKMKISKIIDDCIDVVNKLDISIFDDE